MNLAIAANDDRITKFFSNKYDIVADFKNEDDLFLLNSIIPRPDVLFITDKFCKISITKIAELKENCIYTRFVYAMSDVEYTSGTKHKIAKLIENKIYDIILPNEEEGGFTPDQLEDAINNPKSYDDVAKFLDDSDDETIPQMTLVSSLKPGTGKTFLAVNLAIAISKYGQDKRSENKMVKPRVLLLEGDLANLGVSTTTKVDNYDRNMLTALKKIESNVKPDGSYNLTATEIDSLQKFVRKCLSLYKGRDNLFVMAAADIPKKDLNDIYPAHYYFMVQMLAKAFDVIIVDSNSSFDHQTTAALFELAGRILLLIDNDYNNIQNNIRYIEMLGDMGYEDKMHFIINRDITWDRKQECIEDLDYDTRKIGNLMIEHRIPFADPGIMKSIEYSEKNLVETEDVEDVRNVILDIANDIWKIDYNKVDKADSPEKKQTNRLISALNK